jgi:hypothetical protein
VACRTRRDLLQEPVDPTALWEQPAVVRTFRRQQPDGRFRYPGGGVPRQRSSEDYDQLQTYQTTLELASKYGLTAQHPGFARAAQFLFEHQTTAGDFRGIYGTQYSPNYSAAILAVLVEAGYEADPRVERCFRWLLAMRQDDGGWAIPLRTLPGGTSFARAMTLAEPLEPDRTRPSSHLVTGIVLRAFAAHPTWRAHEDARRAGALLASCFFCADAYPDRRAASYWEKLAYPFYWTDVVSSLDALSLIGIGRTDPHVDRAVAWLVEQQGPSGLWRCGYPNTKDPNAALWVTYAACRALGRLL